MKTPVGRGYRKFAELTRSDLQALAACMREQRELVPRERLAELAMPVLVAVGTRDEVAGSAAGLAALIPGAEVLDIPGRDHMLATGDKAFKAGVLDFLAASPVRPAKSGIVRFACRQVLQKRFNAIGRRDRFLTAGGRMCRAWWRSGGCDRVPARSARTRADRR